MHVLNSPSTIQTQAAAHSQQSSQPGQMDTSKKDNILSASSLSTGQGILQKKLSIGAPDDVYEKEADAVAERVMRMPDNNTRFSALSSAISTVYRKCSACEEEENVQRKDDGSSSGQSFAPSIVDQVVSGSGESMGEGTRSFMESRFGYDFGNVKVHTGEKAAQSAKSINALAYTVGNNIVFDNGYYSPETDTGKKLLAHELTHVVQQSGSLSRKVVQRQSSGRDVLGQLSPQCSVDWQAVWERRFNPARDIACSAQTPLGRIGSDDIYAAYRYLFGNRPPSRPAAGAACPGDRVIPWGGCCPDNTFYDRTQMRCVDGGSIDITTLPCPPGWSRSELGLCAPVIRVPTPVAPTPGTTPGTTPGGPGLTFPELPQLTLPPFGRQGLGCSISNLTIDHFDFDGSSLPPGHDAELDHLVSLLNVYHEVPVHIEGHTDTRGDHPHNDTLSRNRANTVHQEILNRSVVNPARLQVEGFGERRLLFDPEANAEQQARNRRVDIWYCSPASSTPPRLLTP